MSNAALSNIAEGGSTLEAICSDDTCRHVWVAAYLPMAMDRLAKLLQGVACPMCGDDNPSVAPTMPRVVLPHDTVVPLPAAAVAWVSGNDRGMSSQAIWDHMATGECNGDYPYDPADLGRCLRLLEAVPEWKPRIVEMRRYNNMWALYTIYWDELTQLMAEEAGAGYAPKTYDRMQELRKLAAA